MQYAVAITWTDNHGRDSVKAYLMEASSKAEALGKALISAGKDLEGLNLVTGWDTSINMIDLKQVAYEALLEFGWDQKIRAIKAVREAAPEFIGLREAKELVERVQDGVPF